MLYTDLKSCTERHTSEQAESIVENAYILSASSVQLADLRSSNFDRGCTWLGCNKCLGFYLVNEVRGVKMDKSNFGTNRVAQIVTAVHGHL